MLQGRHSICESVDGPWLRCRRGKVQNGSCIGAEWLRVSATHKNSSCISVPRCCVQAALQAYDGTNWTHTGNRVLISKPILAVDERANGTQQLSLLYRVKIGKHSMLRHEGAALLTGTPLLMQISSLVVILFRIALNTLYDFLYAHTCECGELCAISITHNPATGNICHSARHNTNQNIIGMESRKNELEMSQEQVSTANEVGSAARCHPCNLNCREWRFRELGIDSKFVDIIYLHATNFRLMPIRSSLSELQKVEVWARVSIQRSPSLQPAPSSR